VRRTREEAERTREELLRAALSVFSARGYAATRLEDVAREAGVTRGAIYWHFGSKARLYDTLLEEYGGRIESVVGEAVAEGGTVGELLERVFVRQLALIEDDRELRAMMELALFKTEVTPQLQEGRRRRIRAGRELIAQIAGAIREGMASGELRTDLDPLDAARAFLGFENGIVQLWLASPRDFSLKASAPAFAEILLAGLRKGGKRAR
jgi:TetR/AcrR family acrAB operon transcriptional repressor